MNLELLEARLSQQPNSPLFARTASEYLPLGRISEAKSLLISGIEQYATYPTAHLILAQCFWAEANYDLALDSLEEAQRLVPDSVKLKELHDEWTHRRRGETVTETPLVTEETAEPIPPDKASVEVAQEVPPVEQLPEVVWEQQTKTSVEEVPTVPPQVEPIEQQIEPTPEEMTSVVPAMEDMNPPVVDEPAVIAGQAPAEIEEPSVISQPEAAIEAEPPVLEQPAEPLAVEQSMGTAPEKPSVEPPVAAELTIYSEVLESGL